jgi:putative DNA methylase
MRSQSADPDFAKAVVTYLALVISRMADFEHPLPHGNHMGIIHAYFARQALPMIWDYAELNPISIR